MELINAVIVPVGEKPYTEVISNDLKTMQEIVGGYIEVYPISNSLLVICDEEGKLKGKSANRAIGRELIVGNFFIVGNGEDGEFRGLSDDEANAMLSRFDNF